MGTYFLKPEADLVLQLAIVGPFNEGWEVLNRTEQNPTAPDTSVYLEGTGVFADLLRVDTKIVYKPSIVTVTDVELHVYSEGRQAANVVTFRILDGATLKAETSESGVYGPQWNTTTWSSGDITQQQIHDLRIEIETFDNTLTPARVYAAYLQLNTTETALSFSPPADNYQGAAVKKWRPRLKPGAFYI